MHEIQALDGDAVLLGIALHERVNTDIGLDLEAAASAVGNVEHDGVGIVAVRAL